MDTLLQSTHQDVLGMSFLYPTSCIEHHSHSASCCRPKWKVVDSKFLQTMRAISIVVFLVAVASVTNLTSSAAIKRENSKGNQYPWYYWNMDGEQQWQYPPYYMRCGAEGISSLNVLSVSVVGLTALAFTGIPQALRTQ